jgi:hypothetical protein
MLRLAAFIIFLALTSQNLAGGFSCAVTGECRGKKDAKACCAHAQLPAASPTAVLCCELFCGKSPNKGSSGLHDGKITQPQAPELILIKTDSDPLRQPVLIAVFNSIRSLDAQSLFREPSSPLYIQNSAFLI